MSFGKHFQFFGNIFSQVIIEQNETNNEVIFQQTLLFIYLFFMVSFDRYLTVLINRDF